MKIAFVTFEYPPFVEGGAGIYATNLTEELANLGHEVHVIAPKLTGSKEYEVINGVRIHRIDFINKKYLSEFSFWISLSMRFRTIEKEVGNFDILHGNQRSDFLLKNTIYPHVVAVHSLVSTNVEAEKPKLTKRMVERGENNFIFQFVEKCVLNRADLLIANSQYTKKSMLCTYGFQESKIKVIYPGVSINHQFETTLDEVRILRSRLNVEDNSVILFVGRLVPRKGLHFLLRAFKILRERNAKAKLVVVGDGPERERYFNRVRCMALGKDVIFTGFVDKMTLEKIYALSDVVAIPSVNEPFGIVILEAMLSRKPIVASNSGAIPEILHDNVNGRLIDPNDAFRFAEAMELYLNDRELSERVGISNHRKVVENFTWARTAKQTQEAYKMMTR
jgi:glycogen(starch) synthase